MSSWLTPCHIMTKLPNRSISIWPGPEQYLTNHTSSLKFSGSQNSLPTLGAPNLPPAGKNLLRWRPRDTHTTLAIEGPGGVMPLETRVTVTRGLLIRSVHWPPPKKIVGDFIIAKRWFFHVDEGFCGFFCRGKFRENRSNLLPKNEVPKKQTNLGGKPQVETPDQSYHGVSWRNKKDAIRKIFHSRMWRRMVDWGFQKDVWIVGWLVICDFFPEIQRTSSGKG